MASAVRPARPPPDVLLPGPIVVVRNPPKPLKFTFAPQAASGQDSHDDPEPPTKRQKQAVGQPVRQSSSRQLQQRALYAKPPLNSKKIKGAQGVRFSESPVFRWTMKVSERAQLLPAWYGASGAWDLSFLTGLSADVLHPFLPLLAGESSETSFNIQNLDMHQYSPDEVLLILRDLVHFLGFDPRRVVAEHVNSDFRVDLLGSGRTGDEHELAKYNELADYILDKYCKTAHGRCTVRVDEDVVLAIDAVERRHAGAMAKVFAKCFLCTSDNQPRPCGEIKFALPSPVYKEIRDKIMENEKMTGRTIEELCNRGNRGKYRLEKKEISVVLARGGRLSIPESNEEAIRVALHADIQSVSSDQAMDHNALVRVMKNAEEAAETRRDKCEKDWMQKETESRLTSFLKALAEEPSDQSDGGVQITTFTDPLPRMESVSVELKEALRSDTKRNTISTFLTAFANNAGGSVFFGINDKGDVTGEKEFHIENLREEVDEMRRKLRPVLAARHVSVSQVKRNGVDTVLVLTVYPTAAQEWPFYLDNGVPVCRVLTGVAPLSLAVLGSRLFAFDTADREKGMTPALQETPATPGTCAAKDATPDAGTSPDTDDEHFMNTDTSTPFIDKILKAMKTTMMIKGFPTSKQMTHVDSVTKWLEAQGIPVTSEDPSIFIEKTKKFALSGTVRLHFPTVSANFETAWTQLFENGVPRELIFKTWLNDEPDEFSLRVQWVKDKGVLKYRAPPRNDSSGSGPGGQQGGYNQQGGPGMYGGQQGGHPQQGHYGRPHGSDPNAGMQQPHHQGGGYNQQYGQGQSGGPNMQGGAQGGYRQGYNQNQQHGMMGGYQGSGYSQGQYRGYGQQSNSQSMYQGGPQGAPGHQGAPQNYSSGYGPGGQQGGYNQQGGPGMYGGQQGGHPQQGHYV